MKLTDPGFEAEFITETTERGHRGTDSIEEADGLFLWCPCGYGKPEYPLEGGRPHCVLVSFANPRSGTLVPSGGGSQSRHGGPSRWTMSGTGLHDLTLDPSVDVQCWHGWIQAGEVR